MTIDRLGSGFLSSEYWFDTSIGLGVAVVGLSPDEGVDGKVLVIFCE
jgi:hypothetical protein